MPGPPKARHLCVCSSGCWGWTRCSGFEPRVQFVDAVLAVLANAVGPRADAAVIPLVKGGRAHVEVLGCSLMGYEAGSVVHLWRFLPRNGCVVPIPITFGLAPSGPFHYCWSVDKQTAGFMALVGSPIGDGFRLAQEIAIPGTTDLPYHVEIDAELEDGRYVVKRLCASRREGGPPVTTDGLRAIPVARILAHGAAGTLVKVTSNPQGTEFEASPVGPWDDELTQVAAVYRLAYACGLPPTKAVAESFEIPPSTAAKRVMKARKEGLLGETTPGQAGERK